MRSRLIQVFTVLVGLAMVAGCAGKPAWIDKGADAFSSKDQEKNLYAVGLAAKDPNPAMQKTVAVNSGRVAMAGNLRTYVAALVKDFMQSHKDFADPSSASSIQFTSSVSKSITDADCIGSQVRNSWTDPKTGTLYVLLVMPKNQAVEVASPKIMKKAREQQAELFKKKADEALKELDGELNKLKARDAAE